MIFLAILVIDHFLEEAEIPVSFAVTRFFHDTFHWKFHLVDRLGDPHVDLAFQDDVELVTLFSVADDKGVFGHGLVLQPAANFV